MPKITLDIPEENVALLKEVTKAMGIDKENFVIKNDVPEWHKQALQERMEDYKTGNTSVTSWEAFENELDKEDQANEI